jgi:tetratricopeptide (TPR) repeat protein
LWNAPPARQTLFLIVVVGAYAAWVARAPVTVIAPFQLPKADVPFSGEIVADSLQDALTSIYDDAQREQDDPRLRPTEVGSPEWRDLIILKIGDAFGHVEVRDQSFEVEIKGFSYQTILAVAREVMGTQTTVSGDVILNHKELILIARTANSGPWQSVPSPINADGLRRASRDLAEKILATKYPTLAGAALLKDGQADQALAILNRARTQNPLDPTVALDLCMVFEANHRYAEAMGCYEGLRSMNPSSRGEVERLLARAQYLKGDREQAVKRFQELANKQRYKDSLLDLGNALDDMDKHDEAIHAYDEFLKARPEDTRRQAIAHANRGISFARRGQHEEALAEYRKALQYAPGDVLVLVNLAVETANAGDLDAGISQLQSAMDDNVNADTIPFALLHLGALLQEKGDWNPAIEHFRKAAELRLNYLEAHDRLADALIHEGHRPEALLEFGRHARLSPLEIERRYADVIASLWFGNALRKQGDSKGAASAYREAIRRKPDYRLAHCELGSVFEKEGHLSDAIQEYRLAVLAKPNELDREELDKNEWVALAHQRLGSALVRDGHAHQQEGIAELRKAIELNPEQMDAHLGLGQALYERGSLVEAASEYGEAIKINPKSAEAHNNLGLTLHKQGLREQATSEFKLAVQIEPDNPAYHLNLAHQLEQQNLDDQAAAERRIVGKLTTAAIISRQGRSSPKNQRPKY